MSTEPLSWVVRAALLAWVLMLYYGIRALPRQQRAVITREAMWHVLAVAGLVLLEMARGTVFPR